MHIQGAFDFCKRKLVLKTFQFGLINSARHVTSKQKGPVHQQVARRNLPEKHQFSNLGKISLCAYLKVDKHEHKLQRATICVGAKGR